METKQPYLEPSIVTIQLDVAISLQLTSYTTPLTEPPEEEWDWEI